MASTSTNKPSSSTDRDLDIDVAELLEALADEVKKDLDEDIEVIDSGTEFPSKIYTDVPKWVRVNDVVAVFGDLRNSTGPAEAQHVRGVLCGRCNTANQDDLSTAFYYFYDVLERWTQYLNDWPAHQLTHLVLYKDRLKKTPALF